MLTLLTLGFAATSVSAQTVWDGTADISWYDASQSSFDISTPEQLAGIAALVNSGTTFQGMTLNLTADIWLNSNGSTTNNWTPIGGAATPTTEDQGGGNAFQGVFNGHGHAIYNLYCDKTNYFHAGLFGCIKNPCTIDSLVMFNPTVKSCGMMGCLVGMTRSGGSIYIRYCLIVNANVVGTPSGTGPSANHNNIGCIVGANYPNSNGTYVQNCGATGTVSGFYSGGLGGNCQNETFTNCYFAGSINNYNNESGAITAYNGTRNNCYSQCTFSSSHNGGDGTSVSQAIMQSDSIITLLGDAFKVDANNVNNGYPILSFMAGVNASATEICQGESVTLTGMGYDSYLWTPGNFTSETITVTPTTTSTYTMTGTLSDGSTGTHTVTITVYPQAVVNATVAASSDGQIHATVSPETTTVGCGSSDNVTFTVTPDEHWRVASVYLNGSQVYGEQTYGPFTFTINPNGTLANVVINMTNALSCSKPLNLAYSDLYGTNVTLTWGAHTTGTLSEYHVYVHDLTNDTETEYTTTDLTYTVMGLSENTSYQIGVYTFCTDGYGSDTAFVNFVTPCNSPIPVTVGSGTSSSQGQYFPNYTYYNYSYTQQIITAAELNNDPQTFSAIAFQYFLSTALTRNLDIYLAHVPASANLGSSWILPDSANGIIFTLVHSGNVNLNNSGQDHWLEIPFSQTFDYNGTDNLLVAVLDHTGSYTNSSEKYYTHSASNMSRYVYRDASTYDPFGPDASGTAGSNVNNIRFIFCDQSTCIRPNTLTVSGLTDNSADLSWISVGSESSWEIEYRSATDTAWNYYGDAYNTTETLMNLNADTRYYVRVRAVCGSGDYSLWTDPISFRTQCGPITQLPYFNNFDEVISDNGTNFITCWSRLTTNPDRVVRCYGSATHSAPYSLDFNYSPSCTTAAVTPMLDPSIPLNTVMVDFWAYSSLGQGWMEVGTMSDPSDFSTYEFYDTVRLNAPNTWENLMINFENYTGTNQYIAFLEINGTSTSYIFDDFTINYIPVCLHPTSLSVDGLTNTTVTLSWTEAGDATMWEIEYGPTGFTPGNGTVVSAYTNPFTVDNLTPATTYDFYVYANCGSDLSDPFGPATTTPGQYIMQATGSDTVTTCGLLIYDDGGPNGNYSNNCNTTLVLYPEDPNAVLMLTGSVSTESSWDKFYIYDGVGTGGTELLYVSGSNSNVNVISTTGPLTIKFTSDGSVNSYSGYALTVQCISCYPPYGVTASNIMTTSADLNWNGSGSEYLVYLYGPDTTLIPVTDTFLLLSNLEVNSSYTVYVQAICDGSDSSLLSNALHFTTPTIPATLPYTTEFEDATDNGQWGILNGTQTNKWYIGEPTDVNSDVNTTVGGTNGLYVSNDGGASNTYTGTESRVYAFRDILVPDGVTELKLTFDWKAQGSNATNEFLRVYWLDPAVVNVTAGNNPPTVGGVNYDLYGMPGYPTVGSHWLSQQNTWQHEEMLISATQFDGMGNGDHIYRLYFHWRNTTGSSNPPAAVDNITLAAVTCATPLNVAVSNIGENTATVSWSGVADQFGVTILSGNGTQDFQTTSDTSLQLTGLNANTIYQVAVRGYCGTDSSLLSQGVQFTTACGAITSLPYTENFDTYSSMGGSNFINCWYRHNDNTAHYVYVNSGSDSYSGGSLDFHYTPSCYTMAVTPMFDQSISLNTLMIEGMTRIHLNGTAGVFEVGTMSDANDPTTFTPYDTIEYSATFTWLPFAVLFNNYTGTDQYIAFRASNGIDVSYLLDNLTFDLIPSCWHPVNPSASNITSDGATISWDGTAANYVIEYGPAGFTEGTGTTVNVTGATTYTLTGLTPITEYTVYIYSDCGSEGLSTAVSVNFKTGCVAISVPYLEDFDSYTTSSTYTDNNGIAPDCWTTYSANTSYGPPHIISTGSYHYVHSGSNSMVFTCNSSGADAYAALPLFTEPLNTLKVNFWRAMESTSQGELTVGYVTNPADLPGTFVTVAAIPSVSSSGDTITVDFSNLNIANGYICFHWHKESTYYSCCIDDINVTLSNGSGPVITDPTVATNAADNITTSGATLHGTITNPDNVTITAKGFEWKATAGGTYTPVTVTGNVLSHDLTGLNPNTGYTYKAFITFDGQTVYGSEMTFTTLPGDTPEPCDVPTNVTTSGVTHESITVSWDANPDVNSWNIQYRPVGGQLSSATTNTNSYTITGLQPETTYEIQVQANCGDGNLSEWSATTSATTTVGIDSWLDNSVSLYPNPAKEYVDIRVDGNLTVTAMEVYDVYGKLINTVDVIDNPTRINVSDLADGMYFVRVTTEKGAVTKTFVKK